MSWRVNARHLRNIVADAIVCHRTRTNSDKMRVVDLRSAGRSAAQITPGVRLSPYRPQPPDRRVPNRCVRCAMAKTIAIQELSRSEIHDIEAQFQRSRSVAQRQDAEKTPSPQETLKRRRRCFCFATCIGRKKAGSALGKAASQVRHFSNTRVPNSKAAGEVTAAALPCPPSVPLSRTASGGSSKLEVR